MTLKFKPEQRVVTAYDLYASNPIYRLETAPYSVEQLKRWYVMKPPSESYEHDITWRCDSHEVFEACGSFAECNLLVWELEGDFEETSLDGKIAVIDGRTYELKEVNE